MCPFLSTLIYSITKTQTCQRIFTVHAYICRILYIRRFSMKLTCETEINWTQRLKKVGRNKYIAYWKSHNFKIRESGKWKEQIEQWIVILENINHESFWVRGAVCILWGGVGVWIRTRELRVQTSSKILEYDITPRKLGIS